MSGEVPTSSLQDPSWKDAKRFQGLLATSQGPLRVSSLVSVALACLMFPLTLGRRGGGGNAHLLSKEMGEGPEIGQWVGPRLGARHSITVP